MAHDRYFADTCVHKYSDIWHPTMYIHKRYWFLETFFSFESFEYESFWQVEYADFDMTTYDRKVEISATALLIQDTDIYHVKY